METGGGTRHDLYSKGCVRTRFPETFTLSASGYNLVGAGSPAIEAMTDFLRTNVVMIGASDSLVEANARMISRGVAC